MAGSPWTVASARQTPSPRNGVPAMDASRLGGAYVTAAACLRAPALAAALTAAEGPVSANAGLPPTLGG